MIKFQLITTIVNKIELYLLLGDFLMTLTSNVNRYWYPVISIIENSGTLFQFGKLHKIMLTVCRNPSRAANMTIAQMTKSRKSTYLKWITKDVVLKIHSCPTSQMKD